MFSPTYKPIADRPTIMDELLAATFLKFIPTSVKPNHLTVFRFITVPFVLILLWNEVYIGGIILFTISAFSDALDGAMARTRNQITDWGKVYDPLADKLLIGLSAMIVVGRELSLPLALTMIFLEIVIILISFWRKYIRGEEIKAKRVGKIKMILQSFGLGFLLLGIVTGVHVFVPLSLLLLLASLFFAVASIAVYGSI